MLVAEESHWLQLSAYIHLNPVRAGLVPDPAQYDWSSFRDYIRPRRRYPWLRPEIVLAPFGANDPTRRLNYKRQTQALAGQPPSFWVELRTAIFLGGRENWEKLRESHRPRGDHRSATDYQVRPRPETNVDEAAARVAEAFGVTPEAIGSGRRVGPARLALYHHLVEHCGLSLTEVAGFFGVRVTAVSMGLRRFRERLEQDRKVRTLMKNLETDQTRT